MTRKIVKWLLLLMVFKVMVALVVSFFYTDPRSDVGVRKNLFRSYRPNVVFIGTSRTLYGIDPVLFDSLSGKKTRSYNFGMFKLSPYSAMHLADDIITESPDVNTIYIELNALNFSTLSLPPQQIISDAVFRANVMADCPDIDWQAKVSSFLEGLNSTLFQAVSVTPQLLALKKAFRLKQEPSGSEADLAANGHQSISHALSQTSDWIRENRSVTQRMAAIKPLPTPNAYYLSQAKQLIARANAAGKRVVFYCPSHVTLDEYPVLSQVASYLPAENLGPMPERAVLESLFRPEHLFDALHLNHKGAAVYTRYLQSASSGRAGSR